MPEIVNRMFVDMVIVPHVDILHLKWHCHDFGKKNYVSVYIIKC